MKKLIYITILFFTIFSISQAELYKWTDESGKVHYGDKAPNDGAAPLNEKELPALNNLPSGDPNKPYSIENNIVPITGEYRSNKHSISGKLLFDGKPISVNNKSDVFIWMRDEGTGKSANIQVDYNVKDSSIYVEYLIPGEYGVSFNIDKNKSNLPLYPGDYRAWANFKIRKGYSIKRDINLDKIIHLTEPQDNNKIIKKWSKPCGEKMAFRSPVTFRWQSLGHNVNYKYVIRNNPCKPFKYGDALKHGETADTFVSLNLPKTAQNHQYMLELHAYRDNRLIGSIITHGDNGYGWDYRFLID